MDRRAFLKGLVATAAGVLVPGSVVAEPERRVWALDRTMVQPRRIVISDFIMVRGDYGIGDWLTIDGEHMRIVSVTPGGISYHNDVVVERYPSPSPRTGVARPV